MRSRVVIAPRTSLSDPTAMNTSAAFALATPLAFLFCTSCAVAADTAEFAGYTGGFGGADGTEPIAPAAGSGGATDTPEEPRCGNLSCEPENDESCETCPTDCGSCPACDIAPGCTGAMAVPTSTTHVADCDSGGRTNYVCAVDMGVPASETNCLDPQLRIRIKQVAITRSWHLMGGKNLFCAVTAEDGSHSELAITPLGNADDDGVTRLNYALADGIFWGQGDLYPTISNLTITYECFLGSSGENYEAILGDISDRAADVAEGGGAYGWVFGAAALVGQVIGSSLGTISTDNIVNVQQTIDAGALLEFAGGTSWNIRVDECNGPCEDITLEIEAWGCADARPWVP